MWREASHAQLHPIKFVARVTQVFLVQEAKRAHNVPVSVIAWPASLAQLHQTKLVELVSLDTMDQEPPRAQVCW